MAQVILQPMGGIKVCLLPLNKIVNQSFYDTLYGGLMTLL